MTGSERAEPADEDRRRALCPDCEPGAMPPFGKLHGQETFVDESLR